MESPSAIHRPALGHLDLGGGVVHQVGQRRGGTDAGEGDRGTVVEARRHIAVGARLAEGSHRGQQVVQLHGAVIVSIEHIAEREDVGLPVKADDGILPRAASQIPGREVEAVATEAAVQQIVAPGAGDEIVARAAAQGVGAVVAAERVAGIAGDHVLDGDQRLA
ncbi:MAG TPA: hypothetical protein VIR45_06250, partial [Kiloniellaceae bacterium]